MYLTIFIVLYDFSWIIFLGVQIEAYRQRDYLHSDDEFIDIKVVFLDSIKNVKKISYVAKIILRK